MYLSFPELFALPLNKMATIAFGPATRKIFSCTRFTPSLFRSTFFVHKRKFSTLDKTRMRVDFRGHPSKENLSLFSRSLILGIESSCDDTGACVLSLKGEILGEALSTQLSTRCNAFWGVSWLEYNCCLGMVAWFPPSPWPGTPRRSREWWRWPLKELVSTFKIWPILLWPTDQGWKGPLL